MRQQYTLWRVTRETFGRISVFLTLMVYEKRHPYNYYLLHSYPGPSPVGRSVGHSRRRREDKDDDLIDR